MQSVSRGLLSSPEFSLVVLYMATFLLFIKVTASLNPVFIVYG